MTTRDQVTRLVRYVEANRILDALDEFYDDEVSMQDNLNAPVVGKAANRERERAFFGSITVHQNRALSVVVDVELPYAPGAGDGDFEDAREHLLPLPRYVLRQADVYRQQGADLG